MSNDYEAAVRSALSLADGPRALERGCAALRAALADQVRARPAEAGLTAAHVAGILLRFSAELGEYRPERPRGCPRVPRPQDLLAAFEASLTEAAEGEG